MKYSWLAASGWSIRDDVVFKLLRLQGARTKVTPLWHYIGHFWCSLLVIWTWWTSAKLWSFNTIHMCYYFCIIIIKLRVCSLVEMWVLNVCLCIFILLYSTTVVDHLSFNYTLVPLYVPREGPHHSVIMIWCDVMRCDMVWWDPITRSLNEHVEAGEVCLSTRFPPPTCCLSQNDLFLEPVVDPLCSELLISLMCCSARPIVLYCIVLSDCRVISQRAVFIAI